MIVGKQENSMNSITQSALHQLGRNNLVCCSSCFTISGPIGTVIRAGATGRTGHRRYDVFTVLYCCSRIIIVLFTSCQDTSVHAIAVGVDADAIVNNYATTHGGLMTVCHLAANVCVAGTTQSHWLEQFLVRERSPVLGAVGAVNLATRATVVLPPAEPELGLTCGAAGHGVIRHPEDAARDLL